MPAPAWVVLPTYNEAANIEAIVEAVLAKLPSSGRILVVDDNSPDGTGEIAERLADGSERVEVLRRPRKEGLGPAYVAGFRRALEGGAALVLEMDADFSHDPAYLPRLLDAAERADLVIGSRYVAGGGVSDWSALRQAISRGGSAYARLALGLDVRDLTGGFKCFRREVLEAIDLDSVDLPRLRLPGRADLPGDRAGLPSRRGPDRLPRPCAQGFEDGRRDRRRGDLARPPSEAQRATEWTLA